MIVLDTNVISELMRVKPDARVDVWVAGLRKRDIATTSISVFEVHFGLTMMTPSRRRDGLQAMADELFLASGWRVFPFDSQAARHAADFRAGRMAAGLPVAMPDSLIAGIALCNGASIATRNVSDFMCDGLQVIDPWQVPAR